MVEKIAARRFEEDNANNPRAVAFQKCGIVVGHYLPVNNVPSSE